MDSSLITIVLAVIAVIVAWKVFKGVIKTVALLVILGIAALVVFGGGI